MSPFLRAMRAMCVSRRVTAIRALIARIGRGNPLRPRRGAQHRVDDQARDQGDDEGVSEPGEDQQEGRVGVVFEVDLDIALDLERQQGQAAEEADDARGQRAQATPSDVEDPRREPAHEEGRDEHDRDDDDEVPDGALALDHGHMLPRPTPTGDGVL